MVDFNNHLKIGSYEADHRGKKITSVLNSDDFEKFMTDTFALSFITVQVPPGYEHRADLLANLFYDTPTLDWLICWANNVNDPFEQLNVGDTIKILQLL